MHDVVGAVAGHHAQLDLAISSHEPWSKVEILMLKFPVGLQILISFSGVLSFVSVKPR